MKLRFKILIGVIFLLLIIGIAELIFSEGSLLLIFKALILTPRLI